jgi:hypothetical protein
VKFVGSNTIYEYKACTASEGPKAAETNKTQVVRKRITRSKSFNLGTSNT